jgi:hypothetical protein
MINCLTGVLCPIRMRLTPCEIIEMFFQLGMDFWFYKGK